MRVVVAFVIALLVGTARCALTNHPHDASRASRDRLHPDAYLNKCNHLAWSAAWKAHGGAIEIPPPGCRGVTSPIEWERRVPPGRTAELEWWFHDRKLATLHVHAEDQPPAPTVTVIDKRPCTTLKIPSTHTWRSGGAEFIELDCTGGNP